eukprot:1160176-Pelagomonas_calceolata.AAC.16
MGQEWGQPFFIFGTPCVEFLRGRSSIANLIIHTDSSYSCFCKAWITQGVPRWSERKFFSEQQRSCCSVLGTLPQTAELKSGARGCFSQASFMPSLEETTPGASK